MNETKATECTFSSSTNLAFNQNTSHRITRTQKSLFKTRQQQRNKDNILNITKAERHQNLP